MARSKSKNVGLIGLGIIGTRVAAALRKKNLRVYVWNRTPKPEQNFLGSAAEVAELCDLVQIFVADDEALLEIVRQLSPGLGAQHIVTAHSTVSPEGMRAAAEVVQRRGARFLDAPFTGSKVAAEKGELVYYIGGDEAALRQARPILEASSKEIVHFGEIGDATVMKVATNIVTAATAQIAAEALALLRKAGIPPEQFTRAMKSNATNSVTLEMKVPMMLAGDYEPHFSVKHMLKDVRIASNLARNFSLDLPMTEVAGDMLLEEMKRGHGDVDYAAVAQKYLRPGEDIVRPTPPVPIVPAPIAAEMPAPTAALAPMEASPPAQETPPPAPSIEEKVPEELPLFGPKEIEETSAAPESLPVNYELPVPVLSSVESDLPEEPVMTKTTEEKPATELEPVAEKAKEELAEEPVATKSKEEPAKQPTPEGVNLSGGLRAWLSRRAHGRREQRDAGAV